MKRFQPKKHHPLYKQVYQWLKDNIEHGIWKPGEQIPPEPVLSKDLGISRQTLRQAFQLLLHEGLLYQQPGKGTFVKNSRSQYGLETLTSFTEQMEAKGKHPSSKVIDIHSNIPPTEQLQVRLGLSSHDRLLKIVRLRLADQTPMSLETVYINEKLCPDLEKQDLANQSLYNLVENVYHLPVTHGDIAIEASQATAEEAKILKVDPSSLVLYMECLNYTNHSRPLFITFAKYPKERYIFTVSVPRR